MENEANNQKKVFNSKRVTLDKERPRLNKNKMISFLNSVMQLDDAKVIRERILSLKLELLSSSEDSWEKDLGTGEESKIETGSLVRDLDQIISSYTSERMKHYINRLVNSLNDIKYGRINDINLNRWREYENIITDSLWLFDKRDTSGEHLGWYWGNFIPQIPNQLIQRYSKRGEWVFDPFVGSGTTLIECRRLGRNGIGIELNEEVAKRAEERVDREKIQGNVETKIIVGDSVELDYRSLLSEIGIESVQLVIMHPPYYDIIRFSDNKKDLSNALSLNDFLLRLGNSVKKCRDILDNDRYLAIVIGDKYESGQWIPLGFYSMQVIMKSGFTLKSIVVKNFDETRGKMNQKELWRYRALLGEYYVFKHEYIFIFKKG
ncbi:MAG: DNA methyltransferase [Thermoplasmatales archaeon]